MSIVVHELLVLLEENIRWLSLSMSVFSAFRLGDNRKTHINIGKQEVISIPDLRFIRYPKHYLGTLLVMLTEVNKK